MKVWVITFDYIWEGDSGGFDSRPLVFSTRKKARAFFKKYVDEVFEDLFADTLDFSSCQYHTKEDKDFFEVYDKDDYENTHSAILITSVIVDEIRNQ